MIILINKLEFSWVPMHVCGMNRKETLYEVKGEFSFSLVCTGSSMVKLLTLLVKSIACFFSI